MSNQRVKTNVGISLLKLVMCFCVVLSHYWSDDTFPIILMPFAKLIGYAVPVFMFLSFYLTQEASLKKDKAYIKKRLWRLIWPQIGWACIYWIIYYLAELMLDKQHTIGISDLVWQIFTGHSPRINAAMWYQAVIILLTFVFSILFYYLPVKIAMINIICLMVISLIMQYSGLNYQLFMDLRYELKYPLGRIFEMLPYATFGFVVSYYEFYKRIEKYRLLVLPIAVGVGCILINGTISSSPQGFQYSGIQSMVITFVIVLITMMVPFDEMPELMRNIINKISRYTLAVYCMHNMVGRSMILLFNKLGLKTGTFCMCIIVYVMCYIIAVIISKIPIKLCGQLIE